MVSGKENIPLLLRASTTWPGRVHTLLFPLQSVLIIFENIHDIQRTWYLAKKMSPVTDATEGIWPACMTCISQPTGRPASSSALNSHPATSWQLCTPGYRYLLPSGMGLPVPLNVFCPGSLLSITSYRRVFLHNPTQSWLCVHFVFHDIESICTTFILKIFFMSLIATPSGHGCWDRCEGFLLDTEGKKRVCFSLLVN